MDCIQQEFQVRFRYAVHFTRNLFSPSNPLLRRTVGNGDHGAAKILMVADAGLCRASPGLLAEVEGYAAAHRDALELVSKPLVCPGGEVVKNTDRYVTAIQKAVDRFQICRQSFVVAMGGGALLDMAGFAAATAHRGVRLIRVPTTVLSQNDSGVGVKNGINRFGKKNFLGAFAPPWAVLNDFALLDSLSARDWSSGIAEAVKVALIKDPEFFEFIERNAERLRGRCSKSMAFLIRRCAELHVAHIANGGDPFECGSSRPLDFGHWAAHKLEQLTGYRLRHGEAVSIGMALDCTYAYLSGYLAESDWRRVLGVLESVGLPVYVRELEEHAADERHEKCVLRGMAEFREHLGGRLTILLLRGVGRPFEIHDVPAAMLGRSIHRLKEWQQDRAGRGHVALAEAS